MGEHGLVAWRRGGGGGGGGRPAAVVRVGGFPYDAAYESCCLTPQCAEDVAGSGAMVRLVPPASKGWGEKHQAGLKRLVMTLTAGLTDERIARSKQSRVSEQARGEGVS